MSSETEPIKNRGWIVTLAGIGINLALGALYAWSTIKGAIPASWGWDDAMKRDPYALACLMFAIGMIPAGRLQDRIGPRWVATIGGVLVGAGFLVSGLAGSNYLGFVLGFGVLTGLGIGFGYASATPPAVKWFPAKRTGLIAGLVVGGFGLASVYVAPLATFLLGNFATDNNGVREAGVSNTLFVLGGVFLVAIVALAQLLRNPPAGYKPAPVASQAAAVKKAAPAADVSWASMLKTPQFWILWIMYIFAAGVGLMVISDAQGLGKVALGEAAFWGVVVLSLGNAGGRVLAGAMSDRIGRQNTMLIVFLLQACVVVGLLFIGNSAALLLVILALAGANYGANLALFPSVTKDYFGLKGFGLNYGIMFTAWGIGGLVLTRLAGMLKESTGSNQIAFYIAAGVLVIAALLTFVSRALAKKAQSANN